MQRLDVRWVLFSFFWLSSGLMTGGCAHPPGEAKMTSANLKARSGSTAEGHVHFHQVGDNINLAYEIKGLAPKSMHGMHLHEKGDCSAADASSAGGHFNPDKHTHGGLHSGEHHAGDLGNIVANEQGIARGEITLEKTKVSTLSGLSVVIHEKQDDEKSQPAGNSGPRIACGVVEAP